MNNPDYTTQQCTKCGQQLPATMQYFFKRKNGNLYRHCKQCHRRYCKAARENSIDAYKAREHETYLKSIDTPEKKRARLDKQNADRNERYATDEEYAQAIRDRMRIAQKQRYYDNPIHYNKIKSIARQKRLALIGPFPKRIPLTDQEKREINRLGSSKRRAQKRSLPNNYNPSDWQYALEYFHHCCAVCGRSTSDSLKLAADHWIPLSHSDCPGTIPNNIVPLCHGKTGCNNKKLDKPALQWLINQYGDAIGVDKFHSIQQFLASARII